MTSSLSDHDLSQKVGVKGPSAIAWLAEQGVAVPEVVYDIAGDADGCMVVRVGRDEAIIESSGAGGLVERVEQALDGSSPGVYRVAQETTTLQLSGEAAASVLRQTCGVDLANEPDHKIVYTRIAGVSCGVIPWTVGGVRSYRIWVDYSFAPWLWETIATILSDL